MLTGRIYIEISHNKGRQQGKKMRSYLQLSESLLVEKNERVPICKGPDDAEEIQRRTLGRLSKMVQYGEGDHAEIRDADPRETIPYWNVLDFYSFVRDYMDAPIMYQIGENLQTSTHDQQIYYDEFRKNFMIVNVKLPENDIEFDFYLKAFMFPRQTNGLNHEQPVWRAGSVVIYTQDKPDGWFHQLRWRMMY